MPRWKIKSAELKYRNPWIEVNEYAIVFPNGNDGTYGVVSMPDTAGVIAKEGNSVYLVKQYRFTVDKESWELPSGHVEKGRTPIETAKKELREEAGLRAEEWTELGFVHPAIGVMKTKRYLFLAENLTKAAKKREDSEVGMVVKKFSIDEINRMVNNNEICDDYTLTALYKLNIAS